MLRTITAFEQDEESHWVARLSCGHAQHVRHRPPFVLRPWVTTPEGRRAHLGQSLDCRLCDEAESGRDTDSASPPGKP